MESFRSELEDLHNPVVVRDIVDLERRIRLFREGKIDDEKFRSLRLVRGIYGQRQPGVQMVRIKLPFGRVTTTQLRRIADISDEYASGNLHATTRQDIQIHFVSLDKTPELWAKLEQDEITIREACGNTVRNITASATAGVDPREIFDVSPYADAVFRYLLRNPVCQEMGRKFKIAFSSTDEDSAYTFIHDLGFIPRLRDGKRGFRVLIGGGLGANPYLAEVASEFLEEDQLIPFTEAVLRVFDRYGERTRRMKARFKFLMSDLGLTEIMKLVEEERLALKYQSYPVDYHAYPEPVIPHPVETERVDPVDPRKYAAWKSTNTFEQKQKGFFGVYIKLPSGNLSSDRARKFAAVIDRYASPELRVTINQGYLIRFVREPVLAPLFNALGELGLAEPGFDSVGDITACPGTESCNLGISDSTQIALELERVIQREYPDLVYNNDIKIKISGCPNSCGQHGLASIGFHGSSIKDKSGKILPALVVLLGGAKLVEGNGVVAEKVIKIPSRRGPQALRLVLDDYDQHALEGEYFHAYYKRQGRPYFYTLLKPLGDVTNPLPAEYVDWGQEHDFILHTAVGECAGVIIDLVTTLLYDTGEKLEWAEEAFSLNQYADGIYHAYSAFINTAKALLLTKDVRPSTQIQTLNDFQTHFVETGIFPYTDFKELVLRINRNKPDEAFAFAYIGEARRFLRDAHSFRKGETEVEV